MCGICGVVQVGGDPRRVVAAEVLERMTDAMKHRGPNDRGTYMSPGIALGVRRLSIVDVAGGHQPVTSEDGAIVAVQNGELYNHVELRDRLQAQGHRFRSRCDTDILPHLYEEHGRRYAEELRGKFGIAIWDGRRRRAVIARDRLGVKPIYWARRGDLVVFASELKSLLASGLIDPELDYEAIDVYLTLGIFPGPQTPLSGVSKLMPGERLIVDSNVRTERYWTYPKPRPDLAAGEDELRDGLLSELEEAVQLRLMSDVPLGAMLSGGLDSTLIVALMARNMTEPVKTFSVGFGDDPDSELADARSVANFYGADHHELELSYSQTDIDTAELVWAMDEPVADLSALGFLAISELAARHVTVALSGQGADELLGGYTKHRAAALIGAWNKLPAPTRRAGERAALHSPRRFRRAAQTLAAATPAERLLAMSGRLDADLRSRLYREPLRSLDGLSALRVVERLAAGVADDPLPATLFIDGQLALVDDMLHYFDRASMWHSLEVRVPFLDHHVVEYCARIPGELKVRRLRTKYLLKEAARGLVPDSVIDKRKIGFFRGATNDWLAAQLRGASADYLLGPNPRYASFLDRSEVERLVRGHIAGSREHVQLLIGILMLEVWLDTFLERAVGTYVDPVERICIA